MSLTLLPRLPGRATSDLPFHPAQRNLLGSWLIERVLVQGSLSRAFGGVYASIHPAALRLARRGGTPVVYCATHSGWWDGHVASLLNRRVLRQDGFLMMEESNLKRYPFFTWAGVFGVDRDNPRNALASIRYSVDLLSTGQRAAVWMFPQGTMVHPDRRPLVVYSGAARIVRALPRCAIVPVALRYDFGMEQAPDAFAHIGPPLLFSDPLPPAREITEQITSGMIRVSDLLHSHVREGKLEAYRLVLAGRGSTNRRWDGLLHAIGKLRPTARLSR